MWIRDEAGIKSFIKSVSAGASRHLHFTRNLTFDESPPPSTPLSLDPSLYSLEREEEEGYQRDNEKDNTMIMLLRMFPHDVLRVFQ